MSRNIGDITKETEVTGDRLKAKKENVRKMRQEASRLASMANKRLKRLEKAGLKDSPAYKKWVEEGGQKFGIRGKDYNQVQQELSRLRNFVNSKTSTIRGVNTQLKEMAQNTGIKYKNLKDLQKKASKFFELSSKVEQYLRTVDDMASSIGYQKIWTAVNEYVAQEGVNLSGADTDINSMIEKVAEALKEYEQKEYAQNQYVSGWYKLPKD